METNVVPLKPSVSELGLEDLAKLANAKHQLASDATKSAFERWVEVGEILIAAKAKVNHGEWGDWVQANLEFNVRQASKYMKCANYNSEIANRQSTADLTSLDHAVSLRALPAGDDGAQAGATMTVRSRSDKLRKRRSEMIPWIKKRYADDGKFHSLEKIVADLGQPPEYVKQALERSTWVPQIRVERKQVGKTTKYRVFSAALPKGKTAIDHDARMVSVAELKLKLSPLIERLKEIGRRNLATVVIQECPLVGHELQKLLDDWVK
jgi:hypothetical protein